MDITILFLYVAAVVLLISTPGPVVALVVNTSVSAGIRPALMTAIGTNWASLVLILAAALVINETLAISEQLVSWLSVAGCIFIGWIAVEALSSDLSLNKSKDNQDSEVRYDKKGGFVRGFTVAISNPKDIIFFVSFFPQFVSITDSVTYSLVLLTIIWIILDFSILSFYIFSMQHRLAKKNHKTISVLSSIVLLLVAIAGGVSSALELGF